MGYKWRNAIKKNSVTVFSETYGKMDYKWRNATFQWVALHFLSLITAKFQIYQVKWDKKQ